MHTITLKPGREKSVLWQHPWIFSGAIDKESPSIPLGALVDVYTSTGEWIACGSYAPQSQIRVRIWTWQQGEEINSEFFLKKLTSAHQLRKNIHIASDSFRLCFSESDSLPGLIIDIYNKNACIEFTSAGAEAFQAEIIDALKSVLPELESIQERFDISMRQKEGLPKRALFMWGNIPEANIIQEHGFSFEISIAEGHKTGFYLDQRENRKEIEKYASGKKILNCFSYTGGFSVYALKAGAEHVTNVDTSALALEFSEKNLVRNNIPKDHYEHIQENVFELLRKYQQEERQFDIIVLDPPKLMQSKKHEVSACRAYKDLNRLAFSLLSTGGILFTFSCSGLLSPSLFQKLVFDGARDANVSARIIKKLSQAEDHAPALSFPEGEYLKGLICFKQ